MKRVLWLGFLSFLLYFSGFLIWLTPLAIVYAYKKEGRREGLLTLGVALAALLVLYWGVIPWVVERWGAGQAGNALFWVPAMETTGEATWASRSVGVAYFLFYGAIGILLGEWEGKAKSMTVLTGRILGWVAAGLLLWVLWHSKGNFGLLLAQAEDYFRDLLGQMRTAAGNGGEIQPQLAVLQTYGETIVYYATRLLPGMLICTGIFIIWLNVVVARKIFPRENMFPEMETLSAWHLPFTYVWILIGVAGLLLLDIYVLQSGFLKVFALNAFLVFGLIYFFQGLSILAFYSNRWSLSPFIKIIFYLLLVIFFQPVGFLLLAFGFFDSWFDFRKLSSKAARP